MEKRDNLEKVKDFFYDTMLGNILTCILVVVIIGGLLFWMYKDENDLEKYKKDTTEQYQNDEDGDIKENNCSVLGINLHGTLLTYVPEHADGDFSFDYDVTASENVQVSLNSIKDDPKLKAIIVEVDSGGGMPVAGEEISNMLKNSGKPTVAVIRQLGASASYWAISSADKIFASRNSDVGSIGVTTSYLSNVEKNKKDGYTYEQLSAGKYKEAGNPDKILTNEERNLILRDVNIIYNNFIEDVSKNRNIPIEKVQNFADGSTVLGEKAKELGLIDEIGGMYEAEKYLEEIIGEKPEICW